MEDHPIEGLMTTAMESIRDMVDVNTIVGEAVQAPDGTVIIPVSRVCFGFAAGGGEYSYSKDECKNGNRFKDEQDEENEKKERMPFAGGSGAGVSISPVAFMVVGQGQIRLMPAGMNSSVDRMLDLLPEIIDKAKGVLKGKQNTNKENSSEFCKPHANAKQTTATTTTTTMEEE